LIIIQSSGNKHSDAKSYHQKTRWFRRTKA
jgi:hypothetical protein